MTSDQILYLLRESLRKNSNILSRIWIGTTHAYSAAPDSKCTRNIPSSILRGFFTELNTLLNTPGLAELADSSARICFECFAFELLSTLE